MIVAVVEIELYIYDVNSLKDKRSVVKSLVERLKNRYNISIAEVGENDLWNKSLLGISLVANSSSYANKVISKLIRFIEMDSRVEIVNENIEIL